MTYPLFDCRDELEQLKAEAAAMREALEAIAKTETGYTEGDFATSCDCAYCLDMQEVAEKALAADAGRKLLERLRLAEGGIKAVGAMQDAMLRDAR